MKKKDAIKWIEALRSGEYKQGKYSLYDKKTNSYCCLGVLDKINPKLNLAGESRSFLENYKLIGLNNFTGSLFLNENIDESLANLNDEDYSFDEIADVIQIYYVEMEGEE